MTARPSYWVALWLASYWLLCTVDPEPEPTWVDPCGELPPVYGTDC